MRVKCLRFADDIDLWLLLTTDEEEANENVNSIIEYCRQYVIEIHLRNTNVMATDDITSFNSDSNKATQN